MAISTPARAKRAGGTGAAAFVPARPRSIRQLATAVRRCRGCDLCCIGSTQAVFGEGPEDAICIFVGEQPGDQEDRKDRPFVGPAGRLMDQLFEEAGVVRQKVYVTNAVKHFNFVQRGPRRLHQKPMARHISACHPWLEAEVQVVKAPMLVALGATAAQAVMGRDFRVTRSRGRVMTCPLTEWFMATVHPSSLLRIPDQEARREARQQFVEDLRVVAGEMQRRLNGK